MSRRRSSTWSKGGMNVRGRKKRVKLCLAKKLRELQGTVPGIQGVMDMNTLFQSIEKYIHVLEAKVTILRCLTNFHGV